MKQFFKFFAAAIAALFVFFVGGLLLLTGIGAAMSAGSDSTEVRSKSILHIDAATAYAEQTTENPLAFLQGGAMKIAGLHDATSAIEYAKNDDKIKGIYIKMSMSPNGWASLTELRNALKEFKKTDKFIYAYGEVCDHKSYYLASVADKVFINPHGGMEFKGLSLVGNFFKGTFDKLDVKVENFHCGKFKGAHEPYSRNDFSEPNEMQLQEMLSDIDSLFLTAVAERTKKSVSELKGIANRLELKFPSDAKKLGFIDGAVYADSVRALLKSKSDLDADDDIRFVSVSEYAPSVKKKHSKNQIAVLYANGAIMDGRGTDNLYSGNFSEAVRKVAENDKIKGVVLRVNSPGGSALASEIMHRELFLLAKKKPIYVSMGDVAASGGYYISCAADTIFADANTITGSIGVVGVMFNIGDFMNNKLGVTFDAVKTAEYADFPNVYRDMTAVEKGFIQSYLDSIYVTFKGRVAEARGMTPEQVEELAQGHVYSGLAAKKLNLVDRIGSQKDAVAAMAKRLGLDEYRLVEYPKQPDGLTQLLKQATGGDKEVALAKAYLGEDYKVLKQIKELRQRQNKIQAIMPFLFEIK